MKKLTLLFFFLGCLGIYAQDLAVSSNDAAIPLYTNSISESNANNADVVKHVDGLSDKKLAKYLRKGGVADKLIEKANEYYDKMWYAESARIYDMVLEKRTQNTPHPYYQKPVTPIILPGTLRKLTNGIMNFINCFPMMCPTKLFSNTPKP